MRAIIKATEKPEKLIKNLESRFEKIEKKDGKIEVETDKPEKLEKIPGIKFFKLKGEKKKGLGGKPVDEYAYIKLESWQDTVKAFLATVQGYSLVVLKSERIWDLKQLKKYNPDIKHLKNEKPQEELGVKKSLEKFENTEKIKLETPNEEKMEKIYREMLT